MHRFLAFKATHTATGATLGLFVAATFGFANDALAVYLWTELQSFVLANDHVLIDGLEDLELLRSHISSHIFKFESLDTVLLHALDLDGFSAVDIR